MRGSNMQRMLNGDRYQHELKTMADAGVKGFKSFLIESGVDVRPSKTQRLSISSSAYSNIPRSFHV